MQFIRHKISLFIFSINWNFLFLIIRRLFSYLKILILFSVLWIFFSGSSKPLMVACGVVAVLFTLIFCVTCKIISTNSYIVKLGFIKYVYVLLRDVIVSSIQMVKIVYSNKLNINPGTLTINVSKLTNQEKVLFSNLITMTPGTFVIAVNGDDFLIHALNKEDLEFRDNKEIKKLLQKMRSKDEEK